VSGSRRAAAAIWSLFARCIRVPADWRVRVWSESALACLSALLALTTLLWRDWIEIVFHVDPDRGSGALEWAVVGACVAMSVAFIALACRDASASRASLAGR
jgi:hypothetical protein